MKRSEGRIEYLDLSKTKKAGFLLTVAVIGKEMEICYSTISRNEELRN